MVDNVFYYWQSFPMLVVLLYFTMPVAFVMWSDLLLCYRWLGGSYFYVYLLGLISHVDFCGQLVTVLCSIVMNYLS